MITNGSQRTFAQSISATLQGLAPKVHQVGALQWRLEFTSRPLPDVIARFENGWCNLRASVPTRTTASIPGPKRTRALLYGNATLPANVNFCVTTSSSDTLLAAEWAVETDGQPGDAVCEWIRGRIDTFTTTLERYNVARSSDVLLRPEEAEGAQDHSDGVDDETKALCRQTGWPFHERADGRPAIKLDVPHQFCQATVDRPGGVGYRLTAALETSEQVAPKPRHAMDLFLLTASRIVCMVRAAAARDATTPCYRWEVVWSEVPDASSFHTGVSALSVACRMTGRELAALGNESIAREYLKLRGWST